MKKYLFLFLILAMSFISLTGQVYSNQKIENTIADENAFLDANTLFNTEYAGADNNNGKGLIFPSVDLIEFEFKLDNVLSDGALFATYFDGMVVYNRATGTTRTDGNRSSTATDVEPCFYYFYNPEGYVNQNVTDGKWISLCSASTQITISPQDPGSFDKDGESKDFEVTNPACDIPGEFHFTVIAGDASVSPSSSTDGKFTVIFDANPTAAERKAIVLVSDPCGNSATFVFRQDGNSALCDNSVTLTINANGGGSTICAGGSLFLYATVAAGSADADKIIWTRNGVEIGRGLTYEAQSAGKYVLYYGAIGCDDNKQELLVTQSGDYTGAAIDVLVDGNNGYVCDATGTVTLYAIVDASEVGKIVWLKNGVIDASKNGQKQIFAGVGVWKAALKDGSCFSHGSREVEVKISPDAAGGTVNAPTINVTGCVCQGGTLMLDVSDENGNPATTTYKWYINTTQVGTGRAINVTIPDEVSNLPVGSDVIIRCQASNNGCPTEVTVPQTLKANANLPKPNITSSTNGTICDGQTTLSTSNGSAYTVKWFDSPTSTTVLHTGASYAVSESNKTYYAEFWSKESSLDCCAGERASFTTKGTSNDPILKWDEAPNADVNVPTLFAVKGHNLTNANYQWTVSPDGSIAGQGQQAVYISFPTDGTKTVSVTVSNDCGTASLSKNDITIGTICDPVTSVTASLIGTATAGMDFTLEASSDGGSGVTYKWFRDGAAIGEGRIFIWNETTAGNYTYTVKARAACEEESNAKSATVNVTVASNPGNNPVGSGSFAGTVCFDVAETNDGGSCGDLTSRRTRKTNFATNNVYSYKFTPSGTGTVNNVRFAFVNTNGSVITDISGGNSGNGITSAVTATVTYATDLNSKASGLNRDEALTAKIYATYHDGTMDRTLTLEVKISDCSCCGATIDSGWLAFMCHNLGADETLDPFTPAQGLHGAKYRFGAKNASYTMAQDQSNAGTITDWTSSSTAAFPLQADGDWSKANNPCPDGWRLPTKDEWVQVNSNNTVKRTTNGWANSAANYKDGIYFGEGLFLPAAGYRHGSSGTLYGRGYYGHYWSSPQHGTNGYYLLFTSSGVTPANYSYREYGFPVRCVSE